jgi:hypothetical protein
MNDVTKDNTSTMKAVYTVVERGQGKSYWTRVGVGFVNRDGSINLRLDAIPVNGTLQVREWEPYEGRAGGAGADGKPRREIVAGGGRAQATHAAASDGAPF